MSSVQLDARGMKCPLPVLKLNNIYLKKEVKPGDTLTVLADCASFEPDVRKWCQMYKKVLVLLKDEGEHMRAEIRI
jgi:TusA-related sulfurtransferase